MFLFFPLDQFSLKETIRNSLWQPFQVDLSEPEVDQQQDERLQEHSLQLLQEGFEPGHNELGYRVSLFNAGHEWSVL